MSRFRSTTANQMFKKLNAKYLRNSKINNSHTILRKFRNQHYNLII